MKVLITALLLVVAALPQADSNLSGLELSVKPPDHYVRIMTSGRVLMEINDKDDKLMVRVSEDGKVEYGDGYKADSVTKVFWEELAKAYPEVCEARKADRKAHHR